MQNDNWSSTEVDHRNRIWFFPDKFWQTTKGMNRDEVARLMSQVEREAESKNFEALKKYSFVFVGDPYTDHNAA